MYGVVNHRLFAEADALEEAEALFRRDEASRSIWLALRGRVTEALRVREADRPTEGIARRINFEFYRGFLLLAREDPRPVWREVDTVFRLAAEPQVLGCDAWKLAAIGDIDGAGRLRRVHMDRHVCTRMAFALERWKRGDREGALGMLAGIPVPSSNLYRGEILAELGRDREAVKLYREYRHTWGFGWDGLFDWYNYPRALYAEAAALERLGERDEARKVLGRLLRLWERADPDLPLLARAKALEKKFARGGTP